jgi:DNA repair protein RadA/Sms
VTEETNATEQLRPTTAKSSAKAAATHTFAELVGKTQDAHVPTGLAYWDTLLSGGCVPGSVTLLGGEPGIGKSTVLAQLGLTIAAQGKTVLYVTGEESPSQVALRLKRLAKDIPPTMSFLDSTNAEIIQCGGKDGVRIKTELIARVRTTECCSVLNVSDRRWPVDE